MRVFWAEEGIRHEDSSQKHDSPRSSAARVRRPRHGDLRLSPRETRYLFQQGKRGRATGDDRDAHSANNTSTSTGHTPLSQRSFK